MTEAFLRLDAAKQKRILDAAMAEFARYGYERASTNRIVRAAGIGKGMLFHYFNSKEALFRYLFDYAARLVEERYLGRIDRSETDLLEMYRQTAQLKFEALRNDPHLFHFLCEAYLNSRAYLTAEQRDRLVKIHDELMDHFARHVDASRFRSDVPPELAVKILRWILDGYQQDLIRRLQGQNVTAVDVAAYWDEFYKVLDVLRRVFYKGETGADGHS